MSRLRELLLALYQKYLDLKHQLSDLWRRCTAAERDRDYYKQQTQALTAENHSLHKSAKDLDRVKRVLGEEAVGDAIEWAKDRELVEELQKSTPLEARNRRRFNRSDRDTR